MLQLIYELRKNCCGRVDGWTGRVDGTDRGSIRGPRGPKNEKINPISTFVKELSQAEVAPISLHGSDKK